MTTEGNADFNAFFVNLIQGMAVVIANQAFAAGLYDHPLHVAERGGGRHRRLFQTLLFGLEAEWIMPP